MQTEPSILKAGLDSFTSLDLIRKAASHKGLRYCEGTNAYSEPLAIYPLDKKLLAFLEKRNIHQRIRPDCNNSVFTLVDENLQEKTPGTLLSNYWNFKRTEDKKKPFDLQMQLVAHFQVSIKERGVVLISRAYGSFLSPAEHLPHWRMFTALVDSDRRKLPAVAKELADNEGRTTVSWTELGLAGIRELRTLFNEFAGKNEAVHRLARLSSLGVFEPNPIQHFDPGSELFITESAQPKIMREWKDQLERYRSSLIVA